MSTRKTRDIEAALLAKGFVKDPTHHNMFWLHLGNRRTAVRTRLSHGTREYDDGLLSQVARQVGLRRRELDDLIDCPLSREAYGELVRERGIVRDGRPPAPPC